MANYFMPGEVAGIPTTVDPFNPFEKLMTSPMFNMGMGILANNTGHYGQLGPALGRGMQQGLQNIEANKQRQALNEYNRKQQELLGYKYDTDRLKATMKRKQAEAEGQGAANFFKAAFPEFDFSYQAFDDDYELVPVSATGGKPSFGNIDPKVSGFLGLSPEDMQGIALIGQSDPKTAMRMMETAYKQRLRGVGGTAKEPTEIAKFRAWSAMSPEERKAFGEYRSFMNPGQNINITNVLGEPKPVTLPDGTQGFVRFPKGGGEPVVVASVTPPASDTEQMTAGYASRMQNAEGIIAKLGEKGNPSWGPVMAGAVGGEPVRSLASSAEQQQHRQAQEDWVRAKLRKESGAVIAEDEMEREIRTYFPMPWDKPETVKQKAEARRVAIESMKKTAGPAIPKSQQKPTAKPFAPQPKAKFLGFE